MDEAEEELTFCRARPEFVALSEEDVWDAIADDDYGESPITGEVTRLGAELLAQFKSYADERGAVPLGVVKIEARCPIERVAILTLLRYVDVHRGGVRSSAIH